jgi:hypothetical protein
MKKGERIWTKAEDDFLRRVYPAIPKEILAPRMDRTEKALRRRASTLGIPGPRHPSVPRWKVNKETGCWEWLGAKQRGYGVLRKSGKNILAHRHAYVEKKGPIPKGMFLDHICRNPACMNVNHLEVVTPAENVRRGNSAKLTLDQVLYIRESRDIHRAILAKKFGVEKDTITGIWACESWKEL